MVRSFVRIILDGEIALLCARLVFITIAKKPKQRPKSAFDPNQHDVLPKSGHLDQSWSGLIGQKVLIHSIRLAWILT
jgi:hypothetical protein